MNWQPIETAPKDGSMILLGRGPIEDCDAISVPGFWQEGWDDSIDDMGCDSGFVDVHFQEFGGGRSFGAEKYQRAPNQPTHWMPLPAAPGAPAVDESFEDRISDWAHGDALDAERYRWLRDEGRVNDFRVEQEKNGWMKTHSRSTLDAAIDAARAAKESP